MQTVSRKGWCWAVMAFCTLFASVAGAALTLVADKASGQLVGTTVTWSVQGAETPDHDYRLSVARDGDLPRVVYDFGQKAIFGWTPLSEGNYSITVTARRRSDGALSQLGQPFSVLPRATGVAVVSATDHPLVALYSAPSCAAGRWLRVHFVTPLPVRKYFATDWRPCDGVRSVNVYLAGMVADSVYYIRHEVRDANGGNQTLGPALTYRSGVLRNGLVNLTPVPPTGTGTSFAESSVLLAPIIFPGDARPQMPLATDLAGRVIWYYDREPSARPQLWRPVPGGTLLVNFDTTKIWQGLREIDLAGHVVRETTAARISEQLVQRGEAPITSIHHEARRLADGKTVILASTEQILNDVQGVSGPVDVLADVVVVLDRNWQVMWSWHALDHLDLARVATLNEKCGTLPSNSAGCPPIGLVDGVTTLANDWLHSNSVAYSPADGNLIISMRHQDWVIKIDYRDGAGDGSVLWRLGHHGDFTLVGAGGDVYPWFSHQHDVSYFTNDHLVVFDNGNVPCVLGLTPCESRGQTYRLNETTMIATRELSAGLGVYAEALGSAQALRNGNFYFHNGVQQGVPPVPLTRVVETTPGGAHSYVADVDAASYRSFRIPSFYVAVPGAPN